MAASPAIHLKTNRGLLKTLLLGILTLGIYPIVVYSGISTDINILASRYDGRKTMHYCLLLFVFFPITGSIAGFVWGHRLCKRIGRELARRGLPYRFSAGTFWGRNIVSIVLLLAAALGVVYALYMQLPLRICP